MLNHITIMGRMVKDPELRRTGSGVAVTSFALAVDRDFKSGGEKETDFIECVSWRNTAEFIYQHFSKGRMAVVDGRLQIRKWTDKQGNKRSTAEVLVENIYFADSKRDDSGSSYNSYSAPSAPTQDFQVLDDDDGVLPF